PPEGGLDQPTRQGGASGRTRSLTCLTGIDRHRGTVWLYLNRVRPALLEWSNRYDHLREVTRDDVLAYVKTLHGHQRHDQLVALRSLFGWAKRNGLISRNPTSRIKVGQYQYGVLQPLVPTQVDRAVAAAVRSWQTAFAGLVPQHYLDAMDPSREESEWKTRIAETRWPSSGVLVAETEAGIVGFAGFGPSQETPAVAEIGTWL
ncbi:hypothetical protein AB0I23_36025, partial [Streptomyces atratus]